MRPLDPTSLALLERFECLRLAAYDDRDGRTLTWDGNAWRRPDREICLGFPTIGWGRRLWPGEVVQSCTREQADQWLAARLAGTDLVQVDKLLPGANDHQRGAAACFSYNCGTEGLARSGIGAAFMAGDVEAAKVAWMQRKYSSSQGVCLPGLAKRRAIELAYYLEPVPLTPTDKAEILASVAVTSGRLLDELEARGE